MDDFDFEEDDNLTEELLEVEVDMIFYLKNRNDPLFASHVFCFSSDDAPESVKEIVDFSHMWINTLLDSKSITHFFLEDSQNNKKIFFTQDLLSVTIMAPNMPDWNLDDRED